MTDHEQMDVYYESHLVERDLHENLLTETQFYQYELLVKSVL